MTKALAYVRVSTADQAESGASLPAQEQALLAEATRRNWGVEIIREEGRSAKNLRRPALQAALRRLDRGEAAVLMAVRLDRISRSVSDFAGLLDRAARRGWGIVMLSPNIDTADAAGRFTANVLASAAQYERELISVRTREGMAQRKTEGARFGRRVDEAFLPTYRRVLAMRAGGMTLNGIASRLNEEAVPTARGGHWYPCTIKRIIESETARLL